MVEVYERIDPLKQQGLVRLCRNEHLERYKFAYGKINPGDRVLDIACGYGYGSKILAEKASKVVGVDVSKEAIDYAMENYGVKDSEVNEGDFQDIQFLVSSIEGFNYPEKFDAVACFETLEHVEKPEKALQNLHNNLKPSGRLYLSVPNGKYEEQGLNNFHMHRFSREDIFSLLKDCGFTVEKEYCQSPFVGIVQKMLRRGDGSQGGGATKSSLHNLPLVPEMSAKLYPSIFSDTALGLYYIARVA